MSEDKFKRRVGRRAEALAAEALGMSIEDAKKLLRAREAGGPAPAAAPGTPAAASAQPGGEAPSRREANRLARLERDNEILRERLEKKKKRVVTIQRTERDKRMDLEIRGEALASGVLEAQADFAVFQYKKLASTAEFATAPVQPRAFFATMRAQFPQCFAGAVAPAQVPVAPSTAAPASAAPGGGPAEAAPAAAPAGKNVDDMTDREFREHRERNYQYRG